MVKKNNSVDKRSSSAPCGAKRRTVRICFAVLMICLIGTTMVLPASAEGILNPFGIGAGWYTGLADATLVANLVADDGSTGFELEKFVPRTYGNLTQHDTYLTTQVGKEYLLINSSQRYNNVTWSISNARKALDLNGRRYWVARTRFNFAPGDDDTIWHLANGYKFTFEPFAMVWDTNLFAHMFEYDATAPADITIAVSYNDSSKLEFTMTYQKTIHYDAVGYVYPLAEIALWFSGHVDNGDPIYFNSIEIDIVNKHPDTGAVLMSDGISYGILTQKHDTLTPPVGNLGTYTVAEFWQDVVRIWNNTNPPNFDEDLPTGFLANVVSGFFDVEIMPNFSIGGVLSILLMVILVMILLKFFAGG